MTDPADGYLHLTGGGFAIGNSRMSFSGTKLTLDGSVDDLDLYVTGDFTADGSATIGDYTLTSATDGLSIGGGIIVSSQALITSTTSTMSVDKALNVRNSVALTKVDGTTTIGTMSFDGSTFGFDYPVTFNSNALDAGATTVSSLSVNGTSLTTS
ncbi:hypothetical protein ADUPG1_005356, partial [Aduncisulcus paluster]